MSSPKTSSCYSDVVCPFRSYLAIHNSYLVTGGVGERVDPTGDLEKNNSGSAEERESSSPEERESSSPEERESSSPEGLEEYETEYEAISEEEVHCSKN